MWRMLFDKDLKLTVKAIGYLLKNSQKQRVPVDMLSMANIIPM